MSGDLFAGVRAAMELTGRAPASMTWSVALTAVVGRDHIEYAAAELNPRLTT